MNRINNQRTLVGLRVTISQRGKRSIYHADFHYCGQHRRRSLKTTVKKIAQRRALDLENQLEGGTFNTSVAATTTSRISIDVSAATNDFIAFHRTEGRRRKTLVKYQGILNRFTDFALSAGLMHLADIDLRFVDKYRAFRKPDLSTKSMSNEGGLLKAFFGWCVERDLMVTNPLANRKFALPPGEPRSGPTIAQINDILKAASDVRRTLIAVAAFAGVRIGEIARLRVEDVDFKANWIQVVSRPGFETKSGDNWRVPMHPRLRRMLEKVHHGTSGWYFTAQPSLKFPQGGHHISPKRVNEDFVHLLKSLGIPAGRNSGFTFHSLRSSFKTFCIHAGVPREVVDVWQNHAPDRAASHVYYKLSDKESQRFMLIVPFGYEE